MRGYSSEPFDQGLAVFTVLVQLLCPSSSSRRGNTTVTEHWKRWNFGEQDVPQAHF